MDDVTFVERKALVMDWLAFVMKRDLGEVRLKAQLEIGMMWLMGGSLSAPISPKAVDHAVAILEVEYPGGVLPTPGLYAAFGRVMQFPCKEAKDVQP